MTRPARPAPFHEGPARGAPSRRLLLLAYHFPPAQTAGALRWQKLADYAAERGWGVDAITLDPASVGLRDPASLEALPPSARAFGVPERLRPLARLEEIVWRGARALRRRAAPPAAGAAEPAPAPRQSSFLRSELRFHPTSPRDWYRAYHVLAAVEAERDWALRAARLGRALFDPQQHRAVVSCGPPQMSHEGARRLARAVGRPLVLDLRDPWSLGERLVEHWASPVYLRIARYYEARAVAAAALVVMNTGLARATLQAAYPAAADRIIEVLNGCDEGIVPHAGTGDGPFRIAYAGSVYLDRNPANLFRALARVVRELELPPGAIEAAFMGPVSEIDGRSLPALARAAGVEQYVRSHPPGTRRDAERFLASAHVLVSLPQDSHQAIPSKVYEYMRHEAALLVLAEPGSATHELVRDAPADLVAPEDVDGIADALRRRYRAFVAGERPAALASDPRFGRRKQAERLLDAIDALDRASPGRSG